MSKELTRGNIKVKVNGTMVPMGVLIGGGSGGGGDIDDKIITINDETASQYTKMHVEVSDGTDVFKVLEKDDIANDLSTDSSEKVLSARQGKALDDKITGLNTTVSGLRQDLTQLGNKIMVYNLSLTYYSASQLRGTINVTIPTGCTTYDFIANNMVYYNETGNKLTGKLWQSGTTIIASGTNLTSEDTLVLKLLLIFR